MCCDKTVSARGLAMVPLDRALVSSYRLSIVTMSLSAAVWPHLTTQSYRLHRYMFVETVTYLQARFIDAIYWDIVTISILNK